MTATGHAIIGTVIAAKVGNPLLAIPLALLSHIAADLVPHWDTATNGDKKDRKKVMIYTFFDVVISFVLALLLLYFIFPKTNPPYAFLIIITAQLFDWMIAPYYFFGINLPPFTWIYKFQKMFDRELDKPWGIINQAAILLVILVLAKIF